MDEFEFGDLDADATEKKAASGGIIPEGKYHCRLIGASSKVSNGGTNGVELSFLVLSGPQQNVEFSDTLWLSEKSRDRAAHWFHKLGLLEKKQVGNASRFVKRDGKTDLGDCLGNEICVEIGHETQEYKGKSQKRAKLSYWGVWTCEEKEGREILKKLGLKPAAATAASAVAKKGDGSKPAESSGSTLADTVRAAFSKSGVKVVDDDI